jgi:hypothetical protein
LHKKTHEDLIYKISDNILKKYKKEWRRLQPTDENVLILNILIDIEKNKKNLTEELVYLLLEIRRHKDGKYNGMFNRRNDKLLEKLSSEYYSSFER